MNNKQTTLYTFFILNIKGHDLSLRELRDLLRELKIIKEEDNEK